MAEPNPSDDTGRRMNGPDFLALYEKIGDMQATQRVMKHDINNVSTKLDGLANLVMAQGHLTEEVATLKKQVETLNVDKHHRDGAIGLVGWIAQHWPFLALAVAMILTSLWANGKIQL